MGTPRDVGPTDLVKEHVRTTGTMLGVEMGPRAADVG